MSFYNRGLGNRRRPETGTAFQKRSLYGRGCAEENVGAWIATPGFLKDEIDGLDTDIMTTDTEIKGRIDLLYSAWTVGQGINPAEYHYRDREFPGSALYAFWADIWSPFIRDWQAFRAEHEDWDDRMWGSLWDHIQDRRKKLNDLRSAAKQIMLIKSGSDGPEESEEVALEFASPDPDPPHTSPWQDLWSGGKSALKSLVTFGIVGGAVIAGIVGLNIVGQTRGSSPSLPRVSREPRTPREAGPRVKESRAADQAARVAQRIKEKSK